ncbi:MAG: hypothetical protein IPK80_01195 [Nannocystis sp.]|nr:hypothetical protein [Nannocystis sp.]
MPFADTCLSPTILSLLLLPGFQDSGPATTDAPTTLDAMNAPQRPITCN